MRKHTLILNEVGVALSFLLIASLMHSFIGLFHFLTPNASPSPSHIVLRKVSFKQGLYREARDLWIEQVRELRQVVLLLALI